jgi:signal peptidase I
MSDRPPSRAVAVLLAFCLGVPGVGQAYLGLARRAIAWFLASVLLPVGFLIATPALGRAIGWKWALALVALAAFGPWAGALVDVIRLPSERFREASPLVALALAAAGFVGAIVVAVGLRVFVLEAFKIPSGAMIPTLVVGDHMFVDKLVYRLRAPQRGEVAVFAFPENHAQDFVKRVITLPGDELETRNGHPWINGWEVPYCKVGSYAYADADASSGSRHEGELDVEFLGDQAYLTFYDGAAGVADRQGPYRTKGDEYWVMGDNRNNSHDSRTWFGGRGGGVPRDLMRGHALDIWLTAATSGVDWSRFGQQVEGPTLPRSAAALQTALDACLEDRPPAARTVPPAAR